MRLSLPVAGRIYFETHLLPLLRMQGFVHEVALDLALSGRRKLSILVNLAERRDTDGALILTRMTVFNASDRRRYERELLEARAAAVAAADETRKLNESLEKKVAEAVASRMAFGARHAPAHQTVRRRGVDRQTRRAASLTR